MKTNQKNEEHRPARTMAGKLCPPARESADLRTVQAYYRAVYQGQDRRHGVGRFISACPAIVHPGAFAKRKSQGGERIVRKQRQRRDLRHPKFVENGAPVGTYERIYGR